MVVAFRFPGAATYLSEEVWPSQHDVAKAILYFRLVPPQDERKWLNSDSGPATPNKRPNR